MDRPQKRKRSATISTTASRATKRPRSPPPAFDSSHDEDSSPDIPIADPMALLRAHFESQFEPIDIAPVVASVDERGSEDEEEEDDDEEGEEWCGCSDYVDEEEEEKEKEKGVIVVHHEETRRGGRGDEEGGISRAEMKAFLSGKLIPTSKPASTASTTKSKPKSTDASDEDATPDTEALNLKNDLALQRLLKESHLLSSDSSSFEATGKNRHKALDIRLDSLGVKPLEGQKHGWHLRKGIEGKKKAVEKLRRKEAKENGIILEKEVREVKKVKRVREMDAPGFKPAVGRFKNGTLVLSKKDVRDIEGRSGGGKSGRGGGRKGGKPKGKRRK
ncbi:hypothetical protein EX30DRAFT_381784 [Ascodesmis nigricans]|uniref:Protein FAF1 n=1 Tax=Ascodesmis nigricans TaxID=341454 RepID=A0A4S2N508_9PEZI|nr:hypothetical protein EX30DRAFT_381784 [Ascodesmis nigricans]